MRKAEVPQESRPEYGGERRALYAVDETGHYTTVPSAGWSADGIVNAQAVEEYARLAHEAWLRARAGAASPLEFHMYDRRLEVPSLAQAAGVWQWRVRRHLKPRNFARLSDALLARYAAALDIPVDALKRLPETHP
jgi:hypothetical protein